MGLFRRKKRSDDAAPSAGREPSPYERARQEWNERYGSYIARERTWKRLTFLCAAIALVAVFGLVHVASESRIEPWVVEVNKLGRPLVVGPADRAYPADPTVIRSQLARWIYSCRVVFADVNAETKMVHECYDTIQPNSSANDVMNSYMVKNSPFKRAENATTTVNVESVLPISAHVWQIEWSETPHSRDGDSAAPSRWQADVTIAHHPPTTVKQLYANPLGVFVTSFSWSQRL